MAKFARAQTAETEVPAQPAPPPEATGPVAVPDLPKPRRGRPPLSGGPFPRRAKTRRRSQVKAKLPKAIATVTGEPAQAAMPARWDRFPWAASKRIVTELAGIDSGAVAIPLRYASAMGDLAEYGYARFDGKAVGYLAKAVAQLMLILESAAG